MRSKSLGSSIITAPYKIVIGFCCIDNLKTVEFLIDNELNITLNV